MSQVAREYFIILVFDIPEPQALKLDWTTSVLDINCVS